MYINILVLSPHILYTALSTVYIRMRRAQLHHSQCLFTLSFFVFEENVLGVEAIEAEPTRWQATRAGRARELLRVIVALVLIGEGRGREGRGGGRGDGLET